MRLCAALIAAFALAGGNECSAEDGAVAALRERLSPHYSSLAAGAGIQLQPNTPLWERSLEATIQATVQAMDRAVAADRVPRSFAMPTFGMEPTILRAELFYALEDYYRSNEPKRGDVVLFKNPKEGLSYVRRIIGMPGERFQLVEGIPTIDGVPARRERLGIFVDAGSRKTLARFAEQLPDTPAYEIATAPLKPRSGDTDRITLPDRTYYLMGDNRDDIAPGVALVAREHILDRPEIIWLSKDLSRIGKPIQPR